MANKEENTFFKKVITLELKFESNVNKVIEGKTDGRVDLATIQETLYKQQELSDAQLSTYVRTAVVMERVTMS